MAAFLHLSNLSFTYPGSTQKLFDRIEIFFHPGWSAVVGANGSGKSTLLRLISGALAPESGSVLPKTNVYAYVPQRSDQQPEGAQGFMDAVQSRAWQLREMLGIGWDWMDRWESLSGGEQKRFQLAVALYAAPDVLLLDEPTNHLDETSKEMIAEALQSFRGIGILVSHDRALLQSLCTTTCFLEEGRLRCYHTDYEAARAARGEAAAHRRELHEKQDRNIKKLQRQVAQQRQKAQASDNRVSKAHINPKDSDAKEKINLAKLTGKDAVDNNILSRYEGKLDRAKEEQSSIKRDFETGITLESETWRGLFPIVAEAGRMALGNGRYVELPRISIAQGDRIGIRGENGSGKSTLVEHVAGHLKEHAGVLYIPQNISSERSRRVMMEVRAMGKEAQGRIMAFVRRLGSDPAQLMQSHEPSPGESRKLMLAFGIEKKPGLIILDEPTNDLDIVAVEALEEALKSFSGALILVSHDRSFMKNLIKKEIIIKGEKLSFT